MTTERLAIAGAVLLAALSSCKSEGPKPMPPTETTARTRDGDTIERSRTVTVQAKVTKVDQKTRMLTLEKADGESVTFRVDDAVKNLPQVRKGDMVTAVYRRAIAGRIKKKGEPKELPIVAGGIVTAEPGERPAAMAGKLVTVTATVTKIDRDKQEITLKGPEGNQVPVGIEDPSVFDQLKKGDKVDVTYTESLAVSVDKPTQ
jgi:hypothetical protein